MKEGLGEKIRNELTIIKVHSFLHIHGELKKGIDDVFEDIYKAAIELEELSYKVSRMERRKK